MCILVKKVSRLCQVFGLVSAKKLDKTTSTEMARKIEGGSF